MTREEHIAIVSEDIYNRIQVIDHKCRDAADMVKAGVTSNGTDVWFNRFAMECDHIILTGGVVYHFLAGYGGGPKYLLPGIASYETIQRHHNLALNKGFGSGTNAAVRSANMETSNIFHADLEEAALLAKPSFLLNVVVDDNYNIIKAVAGDMVQAHREACALVDAIDGVNRGRTHSSGHRQRRRRTQGHQFLPDHQDPGQRPCGGERGRHHHHSVRLHRGLWQP